MLLEISNNKLVSSNSLSSRIKHCLHVQHNIIKREKDFDNFFLFAGKLSISDYVCIVVLYNKTIIFNNAYC